MPSGRCSVDTCDQFDGNCRLVYRLPSISTTVTRGIPTSNAIVRLKRRQMWLKALKRDKVAAGEEILICSKHFVSGKPAPQGLLTDADWAPSLFMPGLTSPPDCTDNAGCNSPVISIQDEAAGNVNGQQNAVVSPRSLPDDSESVVSFGSTVWHSISPLSEGEENPLSMPNKELITHGPSVCNDRVAEKQSDVAEEKEESLTCGLHTSEVFLCKDNASENHEGVQENTGSNIARTCSSAESTEVDGSSECSPMNQLKSDDGDESTYGTHQDWRRKYQELLAQNQQLLEDNQKLQLEKEKAVQKAEEIEKLRENFLRDQKLACGKITELQDTINKLHINHQVFQGDDKKVRYMTGLPNYDVLKLMFTHVEDDIRGNRTSVLNKFQQFLLTLMRLRLDLDFVLLGLIFRVSPQTVSRAFYSVIDIMYVKYSFLVCWPSRESQYSSMPLIFKESFGDKVAVIIDCFEVRMERPSNRHAAAQVYSIYKGNPTVKILLGIAPQGAVIFVSGGYGGRASDKFITGSCGILNHLRPGDIILADRGFTVHELVRLQRAEMFMPAFKKAKVKRMEPEAIEESRRISNLRIHVERVIGTLRNRFKILHSTLPSELFHADSGSVPVIDKIVKICCALNNVCPTVVPTI